MIKYATTITVNKDGGINAEAHPNAPVIINFYTPTPRGKKYNTDSSRLIFTTEAHVDSHLTWHNHNSILTNKVFYRAN